MRPSENRPDDAKRPSFNDDVPKLGVEVYVFRMPKERTLTFTAWGDTIRGFDVHWLGDRTAMHFEPAAECEHCLKNLPSKWKGYLHVFCVELRQEVFLEFTKVTANGFKLQVPNSEHLRGCVFQIKRGKSANSRMDIRMLSPLAPDVVLPPAKDPRPVILKLYGYSEQQIAEWLPAEPENGAEW